MLRTGTVVACEGKRFTVLFERLEACKECGACGGQRHGHQVTLPGEASVGDQVTVDMPESRVVAASALAYLIPLSGLLVGMLLGASLAPRIAPGMPPDLFAALCALAGLAVALPVLALVDRAIRGKKRWTPQVVAIAPAPK